MNTFEQIKTSFQFLISDFHYTLIFAGKVENYRAENFLVYRNDLAGIQIEICGDETWFHCELRRILYGQPANYKDHSNTVGFEDLAILESNNHYNHLDYFAGGSLGLTGVLENTTQLFLRNKTLFTTDQWMDTERIQVLRDQEFAAKYGKIPDRSVPTFFSKLKNSAIGLLGKYGYLLMLSSDEVSPFDTDSLTERMVFQNEHTKIEITQLDCRDEYYIYKVLKNDLKISELDIRYIETDRSVDMMMSLLKAIV